MKSKIIIGIVAAVAVLGGGYTVSRMDLIGTGKVGIVYNYKDGVQDTVLTPGMHFIAPMNKVKEFRKISGNPRSHKGQKGRQ